MIPGSLQGLPRTPQEPLKMPQSASKTSPRRLMALSDAFKVSPGRIQDALSLPKIPPESPKTPQDLSKARFSMAWETKNCNCSMISILINHHPALANSKHLSRDGGMRGAIEFYKILATNLRTRILLKSMRFELCFQLQAKFSKNGKEKRSLGAGPPG